MNADLRPAAMDTLCAVIKPLGKKFNIFVPLVNRTLAKHKIHNANYDKLMLSISGKTTLADEADFPSTEPKTKNKKGETNLQNETIITMVTRLKVCAEDLQQVWTPTRRSVKVIIVPKKRSGNQSQTIF